MHTNLGLEAHMHDRISRIGMVGFGFFAALLLVGCGGSAQSALFDAATKGDRAAVEAALKQPGANINAKNHDNNTPLMEATDAGNTGAAQALLDAGADPNLFDEDKDTALHFAARKGYTEVSSAILDKGGNPNA